MSFTQDLLTGLAQHLDDLNIGTYRATGAYQPGETAITFVKLPQAPDRVIALSAYSVTDNPARPMGVVGIQVRIRGTVDPLVCEDIADEVFTHLHGASGVIGGIAVDLIERRSHTSIGQDDNARWSTASNYYAWVNRPSEHRDA